MFRMSTDLVHRRYHRLSTGGHMAWNFTSWLFAVVVAVWCGSLSVLLGHALRAGGTATSLKRSQVASERRLTACEELLTEIVQAISRQEARDKMRRVRQGKDPVQSAETTISPSVSPSSVTLSSLPSSEIRRRLATRTPIS